MRKRYYFDHNSSTPMLEIAKEELIKYIDIYANPSSIHSEGQVAKTTIENARRDIANCLSIKPHNIVFTSGASEAAVTLLTPHYQYARKEITIERLLVSAVEHPSIYKGGQFSQVNYIPVDQNGLIKLDDLENMLSENSLTLVAIQAANSETGVVQDIKTIAEIVHKNNAWLVVDAVQQFGKIDLDLKADFYIISSHKIGGPKSIGAYISLSDIFMPKALIKGNQERGRRGGTQSPALCAAFAKAVLHSPKMNSYLRDYLENQLKKIVPNIIIFGEASLRLPNTSFFFIPNMDSNNLQIALDLEGFATSAGTACNSGNETHSITLEAMGFPNTSAIRISLHPSHTREDIDSFLCAIKKILSRV